MARNYSALLFCRSTVRSDLALHQCWNEPVQVDLPRHRGPSIRLCQIAPRREFAKGIEICLSRPAKISLLIIGFIALFDSACAPVENTM